MYNLGSRALGQTANSTVFANKPGLQYDWRVQLYYKDGTIKKDWWIGQDNNPLKKLKFELTEKICGKGEITFAFLDFPIDADDYLILSYKGDVKYRAIVDQAIDPKGGRAKLLPYHERYGELLINNTFTTKTIEEMLTTIVNTETFADTGIFTIPGFIDTGDTETFDKDYSSYNTVKKVIDELVNSLDDRQWGVTADNIFTVYQPSETVDEVLLYGDNPPYSEIDQNIDYSKIKATRYQVFRKVTADPEADPPIEEGGTEYIGQVGYGSGYPTPDIEKLSRKKVEKFPIDELITNNTKALEFAYADLIANTAIPETIKLKNYRFENVFPTIGKKYKVQDRVEFIRRQILDCEALTNDDDTFQGGAWTGATLETADFTTGSGSVRFTGTEIADEMSYAFTNTVKLLKPLKISFYLKSETYGDFLQLDIDGTTYDINIPSADVWWYYDFEFTATTIDEIKFVYVNAPSGGQSNGWSIETSTDSSWSTGTWSANTTTSFSNTVYIDNIGLFLPHREEYEASVISASFEITGPNIKCNVKLNEYDLFANNELFRLERKLEKQQAILDKQEDVE